MTNLLGIIAGNGQLPFRLAEEARKQGKKIMVCALEGETDRGIGGCADEIQWVRVGELGKLTQFFQRFQVTEAVMGGKITKTNLFKGEVRPDFEMIKVVAGLRNHADDALLGGIARYLEEKGIRILDSTTYLTDESLPQEGVLSKRRPSREELEDIDFGWMLAKEIGARDIGQTVVVKKKAVLAVEAIEGTDEAIRRGGVLGHGGVTVVKVAKPGQDMRFDVPTIGLGTLQAMIQAQAKALAFEAGKTILLDRHLFLDTANLNGIAVVAKKDGL